MAIWFNLIIKAMTTSETMLLAKEDSIQKDRSTFYSGGKWLGNVAQLPRECRLDRIKIKPQCKAPA